MAKQDFTPLFAAGFHDMDWPGLVASCLTPFPTSMARHTLCTQLADFMSELRSMGLTGKLWIDGSFVTAKPDPGDVDLLFVPDPDCEDAIAAHLTEIDALFMLHGAKKRYNCHAFIADASSTDALAYWRGLFGFCHDNVTPKGLLVLSL
ncbi:DUF6932 family protein [Stenotrophomonas geniculata]|uniref:Polymerase nucleotidyl transferase domain-containing protein n=1 Tax=Stenotrophomonas geniculata N1 TaxID=1167641 RepID=A0A0L8ABK7_9GAMM|nr:hypothetical protein [Stenotrophomonas geniculata]KOE99778.1 hypothetical protein W7K_08090 [Stenotrophomonas geniculata N1]MBN5091670.1 hypothetical protein [Stenotrophomonas maltophilia]